MEIERDAQMNTPDEAIVHEDHAHEMKSLVLTPRPLVDRGLLKKALDWAQGHDDPNGSLVYKSAEGLRYLMSITSNSYLDREGETITSQALKAYEESCYIGEGLYHNDNPYVLWHDDDVLMGEIIAVSYIEPFLVELVKEIDGDPVSKVLFDFAEKNGHKAGASHRFGYRDEDRTPDGDYLRIYKQESTFLPDRALAANGMTYAGVLTDMGKQSDEWLNKMFEEATGIPNVAEVLHDKSRDRAAKLAEIKGLMHKAVKPTFPPKEASNGAVVAADDAAIEADAVDEEVEEKDEAVESGGLIDMGRFVLLLNGVMNMLGDMVDAQTQTEMDRVGMMKSLDELKEIRMSEKAAEKVTIEALEAKLKALEERQAETEKKLNLTPRRAADQAPVDPQKLADAAETAKKAKEAGELIHDPFWGDLKPLPK